ncbi:MAG: PQQ-dependent sugar dehydrogenase [Phycisphaerae bacterium]|nr:PQQ-dependent sugar dehydrogenase [Phycisphaerae bacterium]
MSNRCSSLALLLAAGLATSAHAQVGLTTVRVQTGLTRPVFVTAPPGDTSRLFVVEQRGSAGVATRADIRILNLATNTMLATPFLTINNVSIGSEQGLLGLAFDPNYATNGRFFVNYTNSAGTTVIARYTATGGNPASNTADPASATTILTQAQPFANHNGGWMGFGPNDGYLYISFGDGGSANDPQNNGQNTNTLLGKMLRIDVTGATYTIPPTNPFFGSTSMRQEIWAYGLRNPWRSSFDRLTGDFYIADVGQDLIEEINFQPASSATAINYGWRCYEGNNAFNTTGCAPAATMQFPIYTYTHGTACSVTGGYVYRGCAIPSLRGTYFFADYCSAQITSFRYAPGVGVTQLTNRTAELAVAGFTINAIVSFGEDANGELYIVDQGGGELYKIVPRCGINLDSSTINPFLNVNDFTSFLNLFAASDCAANCDKSTVAPVLNINDFTCFLNSFAVGCSNP